MRVDSAAFIAIETGGKGKGNKLTRRGEKEMKMEADKAGGGGMGQTTGNSEGASNARVEFNIGGCKFETSRQTVRRIPNTRLTHLLDEQPQGSGGAGTTIIFIDRDGTKFDYVLNFLRNGYIVHGDEDGDELFDVLEKEAQFYGISEMANLCRSMREPLKAQETVRWRKDAIPHYWRLFVKCLIDKSLQIPFTYERNSFFYAKCIACETDFDPKCSNVYSVNVDEWTALGHHMHQICGRVEKLIGQSCVLIKWDNGVITHLPNSAVKRIIPVNSNGGKGGGGGANEEKR